MRRWRRDRCKREAWDLALGMPAMRYVCCLLCLLCPPAFAQQVYKCSTGEGGHAYQSQPCERGDALAVWDGGALAVSTSSLATTPALAGRRVSTGERPRPSRASDAGARSTNRVTQRNTTSDRQIRCESARARREREVKRLGMTRTFDQLRALNNAVSSACNHR